MGKVRAVKWEQKDSHQKQCITCKHLGITRQPKARMYLTSPVFSEQTDNKHIQRTKKKDGTPNTDTCNASGLLESSVLRIQFSTNFSTFPEQI